MPYRLLMEDIKRSYVYDKDKQEIVEKDDVTYVAFRAEDAPRIGLTNDFIDRQGYMIIDNKKVWVKNKINMASAPNEENLIGLVTNWFNIEVDEESLEKAKGEKSLDEYERAKKRQKKKPQLILKSIFIVAAIWIAPWYLYKLWFDLMYLLYLVLFFASWGVLESIWK